MKIIKITTQKELDNLPAKLDEFTIIRIESTELITIKDCHMMDSSRVELWGSSRAELLGSSSAVLYESSRAVLRGSSRAVLRGSSRAELLGSSRAELWGSSSAELYESSRAVLRGSSRAELWGSSSAVLYESSRAVLRGSSSAVLWGSSSAELWGSSSAELRGSSRAELWGSSSAVLWGSSSAELWGSSSAVGWDTATLHLFSLSTAVAYFFATVYIKSRTAKIEKLYDESTAKFCIPYDEKIIKDKHKTAQVVKQQKELSFETYLERGYVKADGLLQKPVSKKKLKNIEVFEVENSKKEKSFVIKKGDLFSHGETIEKAKEDLKYKISSRDTSEFKKWKLKDIKPTEDLIRAYRVITGACEFGVKDFCEKQGKLKPKYSIAKIIEMTNGSFGNQQFKEFFT